MTNWPFLKFFDALWGLYLHKLQIRAEAKNQKSGLTCLFCTSNAFQNGMTQPISTNNHGGDTRSSTWPYWRPGQGHMASARGPTKKLHIIKSSWNLISGRLFLKKIGKSWKKLRPPLVVRACETPSVGIDPKSIIRSHIMVWLIMLSKMVWHNPVAPTTTE